MPPPTATKAATRSATSPLQVGLAVPFLRSLGLDRVVPLDVRAPAGTTTPPWRVRPHGGGVARQGFGDRTLGDGRCGARPALSDVSRGVSADVIAEFERRIGRRTLGNVVASGTEIIDRLGDEHVRTGKPIVYTSADSVFQVAAHEDVIPIAEQYRICEAAFDLVGKGLGVGRVIARPFVGAAGTFRRTSNRHDYALEPSGVTLLDALAAAGQSVVAIGKVRDLFAGRGITRALPTVSDTDGLATLVRVLDDTPERTRLRQPGGQRHAVRAPERCRGLRRQPRAHRRRPGRGGARGCARTICSSSPRITATTRRTPSTDHSREYVPLLALGARVAPGRDLGTRATFADLGQTIAENFGVGPLAHGTSFLGELGGGDAVSSIRETLEQHELEALAPEAAKSAGSRGRLRPEAEDDVRPAFQRDRDRIIHSKAFRRLKHKTQVFFAPAGDHYRTRLDAFARGLADRAHDRQGAAAARGAHRGHRAGARPRAHAVRARRRTGARHARPGRLSSLRAEPPHRGRARGRRPRPQPELGGAGRHRPALEGQERVAGRHRPRANARPRSKAR